VKKEVKEYPKGSEVVLHDIKTWVGTILPGEVNYHNFPGEMVIVLSENVRITIQNMRTKKPKEKTRKRDG
jgi:hypothetical protein